MGMAHKGKYRVQNLEKYRGDPTNVIYRSLWETKAMRRFDMDPNVVEWSSESIVIPYHDKSTGRLRRYFPDFYFKRRDGRCFLVEVKPLRETTPPTRNGKTEKRFLTECLTYVRNQSKWDAARRWCERRGWDFIVITERELGIK